MFATQLGEVPPGGDPDLGGERLKQHRNEIGGNCHPKEFVAISRAGLNIRRKISRIHVGDRGNHRGAGKWQHGQRAAPPAEKHLSAGKDRAFAERGSACCRGVHGKLVFIDVGAANRWPGKRPARLEEQLACCRVCFLRQLVQQLKDRAASEADLFCGRMATLEDVLDILVA